MIEELNKKSELREYLLGNINLEEEKTKIEERLMLEEDYFQELLIEEEELIQDYVDKHLTLTEIQNFEEKFLKSEEGRSKVQFARSLRKYISHQQQQPKSLVNVVNTEQNSFFATLKNLFRQPVPVAAALLAVAALSIFFVWRFSADSAKDSKFIASLNKAYSKERPLESRITGLSYAPPAPVTRGAKDDTKVDKNELKRAENMARDDVSEKPSAESSHELGRFYLSEKNFDEAIKQFDSALKLAPNNAKLHSDLGTAWLEKGKLDESKVNSKSLEFLGKANEEFQKAIDIDKNLGEAYFNKAWCVQLLQAPSQAKEAWQNYLKIDSSSPWANEARENLKLLEDQKPISKTKEEILQDFLTAYQQSDHEKAWLILSRNREIITGKLIPQQLAFLLVESRFNGDEAKAKEYLDALGYVGKLEKVKSGDGYWKDVADFYTTVSKDQLPQLKEAQESVWHGYNICVNLESGDAVKHFQSAEKLFAEAGDLQEANLSKYWISYPLFLDNSLNESSEILLQVNHYAEKNKYKWLGSLALAWLGVNTNSESQYSASIEYNKKAIKLSEEIADAYQLEKLYSLTNDYYQQMGQNQQAMIYAQKSLEKGTLPEAVPRQKWRDYDYVAGLFYRLNFYNTSEIYRKEALNVALTETNDPFFVWTGYAYLGSVYGKQGKFAEAFDLMEKARQEVKNKLDKEKGTPRRYAIIDLRLANIKRQAKNYYSALESYDKAISFYDTSEYTADRYEAHKGRLLAYLATKNDSAIEQELPIILDLFNSSRKKILEEQNRNSFFDNEQDVYDLAVGYAHDKGDDEKAFDYLEDSRSRSLLDLMNSTVKIAEFDSTPEIKLSSNISEPLKLAGIRAQMPEKTQLVQYAMLPDKVLIWLITKDKFSVSQTEIKFEDLKETVNSYLDLLKQGNVLNTEKERELASQLYQTLITPIEDKLDQSKEICLIPDKSLLHLPFSTLISPKSGKYFISDFNAYYAPSANVFLLSSKNAKERENDSTENLLSIGNPTFNQKEFADLPKLGSAKNEAEGICQFYKKPTQLIGKEATKDNVQRDLPKANIVNFAGHYVVDENNPLLSGLVLTENAETHERKDSVLANYEIVSEKLANAKLIVLSACQTGIEGFYNGEGMFGASRTFLATGVPLVVASQWSVDSDATSELMINFHRYRKLEKLSTAAALRKAQLEMLNTPNGKFHHPYFWAGFITLGGSSKF